MHPPDDEDIRRIQLSYARVILDRDRAAELFYRHLFDEDPSLRPLFRNDIEAQGSKLIGALGMLVFSMRDPEKVHEAVLPLARRHVGYGVRPTSFRAFGAALMKTLAEILEPEDFDDAIRRAWEQSIARLSGLIARAMQEVRGGT